jgi:DNA-binding LacI/PurR family transcriptional regulator
MVTQENLERTLEFARAILSSPHSPTALFCVNDALAQAMSVSLARLGVSIPGQVSLTGFDGMQYLPTGLRLTTVRRDASLMGREAVRLLAERIANPSLPSRRLILPVDFSPGETTGPAPLHPLRGSHE